MDKKENVKKEDYYDSTNDSLLHMLNIQNVFDLIILPELSNRAINHDSSKLEDPEKEVYDKYIPLLRTAKYGTPEYEEIRKNMYNDGLKHHYESNRHHPEHFKNGISDFTIIDLVEMICDHFAASLRSDTSFIDGLDNNAKKYKYPKELTSIITNTYNEYFKDFENMMKHPDKNQSIINDYKLLVYERHLKGEITDNQRDRMLASIKFIEKP